MMNESNSEPHDEKTGGLSGDILLTRTPSSTTMRIPILGLLVLAAALAGCADDDSGDGDNGPTTTTQIPGGNETLEPFVKAGTGSSGTSAGAGGTGVSLGGSGGDFAVEENATLIFAEIRWDDPAQDIDLALDTPDGPDQSGQDFFDHTHEGGSPGMPDSPHSLTVTPADATDWAGAWRVAAFGNGPAADVPYTWAVTVFYGETAVPEGYSALPA